MMIIIMILSTINYLFLPQDGKNQKVWKTSKTCHKRNKDDGSEK